MSLCLYLATFTVISRGAWSLLETGPSNAAAVEGGDVTFRCRADNAVTWILYGLVYPDVPAVILYDGFRINPDYTNRYSLIADVAGQFDLQLVNASQRDAGTYTCSDLLNTNDSASALLTVIATAPNITVSSGYEDGAASGDLVSTYCFVRYNGSAWLAPRLVWYSEGAMLHNDTVVWDDKHVLVWSWHNYTAEWPRTLSLTCEAYFKEPIISSGQPANLSHEAPTLRVNSTSRPEELIYGAVNATIGALANGTHTLNDILNCSAAGLPAPSFAWRDVDTHTGAVTESEGPRLQLASVGWRAVTCVAYNDIHGVRSNASDTAIVYVVGSEERKQGLSGGEIAGIVIGVVAGVALACGIAFFIYRRSRGNEQGAEPGFQPRRLS